jgi:hypothetical protein
MSDQFARPAGVAGMPPRWVIDLSKRERRTEADRPHAETEDPRREVPQERGRRLDAQAKRAAVGSHACPSCHKASLDEALVQLHDAHRPLSPAACWTVCDEVWTAKLQGPGAVRHPGGAAAPAFRAIPKFLKKGCLLRLSQPGAVRHPGGAAFVETSAGADAPDPRKPVSGSWRSAASGWCRLTPPDWQRLSVPDRWRTRGPGAASPAPAAPAAALERTEGWAPPAAGCAPGAIRRSGSLTRSRSKGDRRHHLGCRTASGWLRRNRHPFFKTSECHETQRPAALPRMPHRVRLVET